MQLTQSSSAAVMTAPTVGALRSIEIGDAVVGIVGGGEEAAS